MPKETKASARGRPRSEEARRAVLKAARALVQQGGYRAATIDAIAERSGVAKTTIYRWWPNRAKLIVELLVEITTRDVPLPGGKDPLRAIRGELKNLAAASNDLTGRLMASLLGEAQSDPEVREALLEGLFYARREASSQIVRQAQAAGTLRQDIDPHFATDLLYGPLFFRMLVRLDPVTDQFVTQVMRYVIEGLSAPNARRK